MRAPLIDPTFRRHADISGDTPRPIPERTLSAISMAPGFAPGTATKNGPPAWRPTFLSVIDLMIPSASERSYTPDDLRRARVIATTVCIWAPQAVFNGVAIALFTEGMLLVGLTLLLGALASIASLYQLHRGAPTVRIGAQVTFSYLLMLAALTIDTAGITGSAAVALTALPVLALVLCTPRWAALTLYAVCLALANVTAASVLALIPDSQLFSITDQLGHGVGLSILALSTFAIAHMVMTTRKLAETDVREINGSLAHEVKEHRQTRERLRSTHKELLAAARRAGAAEVATGVLHNVGNGLNAVNVGAALVDERLHGMRLERVGRLATRLEDEPNIDPRLPEYALGLFKALEDERDSTVTELRRLRQAVDHVAATVATQQRWAQNAGVTELIELPLVVSEVIAMTGIGEHHNIEVIVDLSEMPSIITDRHRLIQILANLMTNAKDAVKHNTDALRRIRIRAKLDSQDQLEISVTDTGHGIEPQNTKRIFRHGFTTKATGHGFGLHASALAATELKGTLQAHSAGRNQGATFVLTIPVHVATQF